MPYRGSITGVSVVPTSVIGGITHVIDLGLFLLPVISITIVSG